MNFPKRSDRSFYPHPFSLALLLASVVGAFLGIVGMGICIIALRAEIISEIMQQPWPLRLKTGF
jgi:hypothetical protein